MNKINIVGIGPGHREYILPIAYQVVDGSDLIIASKRQQKAFDLEKKEVFTLTADFQTLKRVIETHRSSKVISLLVSGDPTFYSMLRWMKKNFNEEEFHVIPGISSIQYFFNKLKKSYHKSYWVSLHGRENEYVSKIEHHRYVALLTDAKNTPATIARTLYDRDLCYTMYIGENLSYDSEVILKGTPVDFLEKREYKISVVVIENENYKG